MCDTYVTLTHVGILDWHRDTSTALLLLGELDVLHGVEELHEAPARHLQLVRDDDVLLQVHAVRLLLLLMGHGCCTHWHHGAGGRNTVCRWLLNCDVIGPQRTCCVLIIALVICVVLECISVSVTTI